MGSPPSLGQIHLGIHFIGPVDSQVNGVHFVQGSEGNAVALGQYRCLKGGRYALNIGYLASRQPLSNKLNGVGRGGAGP